MSGRRQLKMDFDHEPVTQATIDALAAEMTDVYLRDDRPWVIGFSGGKDSSWAVQLAVRMLMNLRPEQRTKTVWIISSDTMVENPRVAAWLDKCHDELRDAAECYGLPLNVAKVYPRPQDSFWTCLLGKGYPAPTSDFRWCTGRMKIDPSEAYVIQHIEPTGRILQILGSRKAESKAREQSIEAHAMEGKFGTCGSLAEGIAYMPIQEFDNDHVWEALRLFPTPWERPLDTVLIPDPLTGEKVPHYNNELFEIYQDGHGGECVLEFDRRTATCGGSRFGCWTCTVVPEDKSMTNMVMGSNPELAPLLAFRQKIIDYRNDRTKRDSIGRNGRLRLNSPARAAAAKAYAGEWSGDLRYLKAFDAGIKYRPDNTEGLELATACELCVQRLVSPHMDAGAIREAFAQGITWAALVETFQDGAKWAARDHYKPSGKTADEMVPAGDDERAAWLAGVEWSRAALAAGAESPDATPGPYLLDVRAELLRDLFEIEKALPGFTTITDTDLHWIKHWWENDGGDPGIADRLLAEYK